MTWIKTIPTQQADAPTKNIYKLLHSLMPKQYQDLVAEVTRPDGGCDSIVEAHSLFPEVMSDIFSAFAKLVSTGMPLDRRQQEMINTVVSSVNRCHY